MSHVSAVALVVASCTLPLAACKHDASTEQKPAHVDVQPSQPSQPAAPIAAKPVTATPIAAKPAVQPAAPAAPAVPTELVGTWVYTDRDDIEGTTTLELDASGSFSLSYNPMHDGGCEILGRATVVGTKLSVATTSDNCRELKLRSWTVKLASNNKTLTLADRLERGARAQRFSRTSPPPAPAAAAAADITLKSTLTNDDPRYKGAAILTASAPLDIPADIVTSVRMAVYPSVLSADGKALAYLAVQKDGPLQLRVYHPGRSPKTLVTFDDENDGSPRMAWSPDGKKLALIELRLGRDDSDWRHPKSRLTVLDVSADDEVTGRFTTPVTPFFSIGDDNLSVPVWKDANTIAYDSMNDGSRGPQVTVKVD